MKHVWELWGARAAMGSYIWELWEAMGAISDVCAGADAGRWDARPSDRAHKKNDSKSPHLPAAVLEEMDLD